MAAGVEVTTAPQVPFEQVPVEQLLPQLLLVPQELPLQPRERRPPALASMPNKPATAKASANSFKVFMTNPPAKQGVKQTGVDRPSAPASGVR